MSTLSPYVVASAEAFMQGLYPPVNNTDSNSVLANGSVIRSPLGGYQYTQIFTASRADPNVVILAGNADCQRYDNSVANYSNSQESLQTKSSTQDFYASFQSEVFAGVFPESQVNYDNAYLLFDYLNYGNIHNSTISRTLSSTDLARARGLADQWFQAVDGNTSETLSIQTIAGQTLAADIIERLTANVVSNGETTKLSLLFGSFEPMISLAALTQLPKTNTQFHGMPQDGSSMVFEMYSKNHNSSAGYPDASELFVRFLFRNGTDPSSALITYPLFGRSETRTLSLNDFAATLENIAVGSVGDWCNACQSYTFFCAAFIGGVYTNSSSGSDSDPAPVTVKHTMKPAVAGVIGAVIALVIAGILFAIAMLVGGFRIHRSQAQRRSELGGFKAGEKLASDHDLPHGPTGIGASVVKKGDDRIGSWELGERSNTTKRNAGGFDQQDSIRRPSFEADDLEPHPSVEPTKVDERI
ncbi:hypothetical protein MMC07_008273 [Pseudocyphellaria aurata]|nr:hypothetical protein [Pseudocyphellaria aurata]